MSARFSVVVPTYRRPELLSEALDSIRRQTEPDFECIVVSDGDPGAASALPDDARFRLRVLETNSGAARSRNVGAEDATGDVLVFCDDDDLLDPRRLELIGSPSIGAPIVICRSAYLGERPGTSALPRGDRVAPSMLASTTPHLGATSVRREAWQPLDETYRTCEDVEWWIRQIGTPLRWVPEVGYWVRRHTGDRGPSGSDRRAADSRRLLEHHRAFFVANSGARAFRLRRIAILEAAVGHRSVARRSALRSLGVRPSVGGARTLLRLMVPGAR